MNWPSATPINFVAEDGALAGTKFKGVGFAGADPINAGTETAQVLATLFNNKFGVKRLAPGSIKAGPGEIANDSQKWICPHDASTLAGNSGSAVVDLGVDGFRVVGLHLAGLNRDLPPGSYSIKDEGQPGGRFKVGMTSPDGGASFYFRLKPDPNTVVRLASGAIRDEFCIHPDGGPPGTLGRLELTETGAKDNECREHIEELMKSASPVRLGAEYEPGVLDTMATSSLFLSMGAIPWASSATRNWIHAFARSKLRPTRSWIS